MEYVYGLLFIIVVSAGAFALLNRPRSVHIDAEPPIDFPQRGFAHGAFQSLLGRFVDGDGNIDYAAWHDAHEALAQLDTYLAAVARFSPENAPQRFSDDSDRLAYWMYAYNAYVIRTVLHNWPLKSVTDLKAPLEVVKGLGFFYRLRFNFGGTYLSLLSVENSIIRKRFADPRIHFILNCASESCPATRAELPTGDDLEALLAASATDFVSDPRNVTIDDDKRQIVLSRIFKWFRKDFVTDLARRGLPSGRGVVDYIAGVASPSLRTELDRAAGYDVVFRDYDWSLNDARQSAR